MSWRDLVVGLALIFIFSSCHTLAVKYGGAAVTEIAHSMMPW